MRVRRPGLVAVSDRVVAAGFVGMVLAGMVLSACGAFDSAPVTKPAVGAAAAAPEAGTAAGAATGAAAGAATGKVAATEDGIAIGDRTGLRFRGAVIRFPPGDVRGAGRPYIHDNATHVALGVKSVSVDSAGNLVIKTNGMSPVVSAAVSGDETLSARGIIGGASVGAVTRITFYQVGTGRLRLNRQTHWNAIAGDRANVWVTWISVAGAGQRAKAGAPAS
ncbi:MAG: hypothetical protein L0Y54_07010 [Sporichthyaceae bacterium]|nr:hypothetical protein [Sporichthyaceae bacterium]